jgi:phosphoenolpyruvate-protein kinase (PTS system EI component)
MIKWLFVRYQVEVSLDVENCETYAALQIRALHDVERMVDRVKAMIIGQRCPRYGSIDESMIVNAFDLNHALTVGLANEPTELIEGAEIYANYKPKPSPPGMIY